MSELIKDPVQFGKILLETEDLDPIYVILHKAEMSPSRLKRWLLAYWFFYHAGVASKLSNYHGKSFFRKARNMSYPERKTPRGTERRHFRGKACVKSINYFLDDYDSAEDAVNHVLEDCADVGDVLAFVKQEWPLFGPWIGFKMADMIERLGLAKVEFPIVTLDMYSEPTAGAKLVAKKLNWVSGEMGGEADTAEVVEYLIRKFHKYKAPPRYERPVGVQEVETILCKWKSHMNGHYPIGKDTREIREGLHGWGPLATKLRHLLPKGTK